MNEYKNIMAAMYFISLKSATSERAHSDMPTERQIIAFWLSAGLNDVTPV